MQNSNVTSKTFEHVSNVIFNRVNENDQMLDIYHSNANRLGDSLNIILYI